MADSGTIVLGGAAALAAAEATGTTNFLGGDSDGDGETDPIIQQPEGPDAASIITTLRNSGAFDAPDPAATVKALADSGAFDQPEPASPSIDPTTLAALLANRNDTARTITETAQGGQEVVKIVQEAAERTPVPTGSSGDSGSTSPGPGPTDTTRDRGREGYDLQQDYQGPGSELIGGGAETLAETGQTVNDVTDSQVKTADDGETVLTAPYEAGKSAGQAFREVSEKVQSDVSSDTDAVKDGWNKLKDDASNLLGGSSGNSGGSDAAVSSDDQGGDGGGWMDPRRSSGTRSGNTSSYSRSYGGDDRDDQGGDGGGLIDAAKSVASGGYFS